MLRLGKAIEALTVDDLTCYPVWRLANDDALGEMVVKPIRRLPVTSLRGKLVGTQVRMANGRLIWALLGNLDTKSPGLTRHFRAISFERDGQWFHMARYHDYDYGDRGPDAAASFLGLPTDAIFPIVVDLRRFVRSDDTSTLVFNVELEPMDKLSEDELMDLAIRGE